MRHLYELPNLVYSLSNVATINLHRHHLSATKTHWSNLTQKVGLDRQRKWTFFDYVATWATCSPCSSCWWKCGRRAPCPACRLSPRFVDTHFDCHLKTVIQALFFMVFATRYVDLFTSYISAYNTTMKCLFLFISFLTVYFCYIKFRSTYNEEGDK